MDAFALHFADMRQSAQHPAIGLVAGDAKRQIGPRQIDWLGVAFIGKTVSHFGFGDDKTNLWPGCACFGIFLRAGLGSWQGQVDCRIARIFRQIQRRRWRLILWNGERGAIGHDAHCPDYREFAQRSQLLIDDDLAEPPRIGSQHRDAGAQPEIEAAVSLLEVLRTQELALSPRNAISCSH